MSSFQIQCAAGALSQNDEKCANFQNTRAGCRNPNDSGVGDFVLDLELGLQTAEAGSESKQEETNRKPEREREPRSKKEL